MAGCVHTLLSALYSMRTQRPVITTEQLYRYILDRCSAEERMMIESAYIADHAVFERMLVLERQMREAHGRGELANEDAAVLSRFRPDTGKPYKLPRGRRIAARYAGALVGRLRAALPRTSVQP